jgi:hypothetical protein
MEGCDGLYEELEEAGGIAAPGLEVYDDDTRSNRALDEDGSAEIDPGMADVRFGQALPETAA